MGQWRTKLKQQDEIEWQHSHYDGRIWRLNSVTYIKFSSEQDKANFAKWAYSTYSGRKPLIYWDYNNRTITHRSTNSPHRIVFAPFLSRIDRLQGLPLQVCSFLLTKGDENAPYRGSTTLSLRPEDIQVYDRDGRQIVIKTMYNSDNGCITVMVVDELREYTEEHFFANWTKTHDRNPKYRLFAAFPYNIEFSTLRQEDYWRRPMDLDRDDDDFDDEDHKGNKGGKGGKGKAKGKDFDRNQGKGKDHKGYDGGGKDGGKGKPQDDGGKNGGKGQDDDGGKHGGKGHDDAHPGWKGPGQDGDDYRPKQNWPKPRWGSTGKN
jgi:hypothetical protein